MKDKNQNYYAIIPASVRYDKNIISGAKLLFGEITALSNKDGHCWATNRYFAELYGVSIKTISTWIKSLSDAEHIKTEIIYRDGTSEIVKRYIRIGTYPTHKKVQGYPQKGVEPTNEKVTDNNTLNNTINKKSKPEIQLAGILPEKEDLLIEWINYRKEIKKPLKQISIKTVIKKFNKTPKHLLEEAIEKSIENSYQGLFIEKEKVALKRKYDPNNKPNHANDSDYD